MVGGAFLSSMHWSDAPVTPDPVRRGSSCDGLVQGMAHTVDDVPVVVCWQRREPRPSRCRGRTIMGGSAGASPEATETPKQIVEARRERLVFVRRFRGYRDPDMTLHAALSSKQGLGSIVQHRC